MGGQSSDDGGEQASRPGAAVSAPGGGLVVRRKFVEGSRTSACSARRRRDGRDSERCHAAMRAGPRDPDERRCPLACARARLRRPCIGVLALQGDVREHLRVLPSSGRAAVAVRRPSRAGRGRRRWSCPAASRPRWPSWPGSSTCSSRCGQRIARRDAGVRHLRRDDPARRPDRGRRRRPGDARRPRRHRAPQRVRAPGRLVRGATSTSPGSPSRCTPCSSARPGWRRSAPGSRCSPACRRTRPGRR